MSEVIVRMEMPTGCRWNEGGKTKRCPIAEWGGACAVTKLFESFNDNRPSWCPIVGVLPEQHGDLIDRDQFKENLDMVCYAGGWLNTITQAVRDYCNKQVDAEKTIVPATERSEHEV